MDFHNIHDSITFYVKMKVENVILVLMLFPMGSGYKCNTWKIS